MAGETVSSKYGASVGAGADEDSAVGAQNYIRVTGTCPEYYSVNGVSSTYYTITFDANGGSLSTTSKTVVGGTAMGYSPTPYRLGYQFDGWFTAAEDGVQYTSDTVVNSNITLYAHWTRIVLLEGYCGDNLYFVLYADGGLEFTGYGDMTSHPWTNKYSKRVYEVSMSQEVTGLCSSAFEGCQYMLPFELPNISTIPSKAFKGCESINYYNLPNQIIAIYEQAFGNCINLKNLDISNSLTTIGTEAFYNCSKLEKVNLPKTLTTVNYNGTGNGPFYGCNGLKTATIEDGAATIPDHLFCRCKGLETVTIPSTVTYIGEAAFCECENLQSVTIPRAIERAGYNGNGNGPFYGCNSLKTAIIEDGATTIPDHLFCRCKGLETVSIPSTVTYIGEAAFCECESLQSVTIPKSIERVGFNGSYRGTFYGCKNLKTAVIEDGATVIPSRLFSISSYLENLVIPASVKLVERDAFYNCSELKQAIYFGDRDNISINNTGNDSLLNVLKCLIIGDTNLDGKITITDVTAIQRHLAELELFSDEQLVLADTNGDGIINIIDATHLQKYLAEFDGIVLGKQ